MAELSIRPYRESDRDAVARICLLTGDDGQDATGKFHRDSLLADVWALPYVTRDPGLAFVVDDDGDAVGYIIAAVDTDAYSAWFHDEWWPTAADRYRDVAHLEPDAAQLAGAAAIGTSSDPYAREYPAHLHIDLLPQAQGAGFGRRLMDTLFEALRARGVRGVHLSTSDTNTGAVAFYERLGFTRLPADSPTFGMRLD